VCMELCYRAERDLHLVPHVGLELDVSIDSSALTFPIHLALAATWLVPPPSLLTHL
jgi:hypothetical protein